MNKFQSFLNDLQHLVGRHSQQERALSYGRVWEMLWDELEREADMTGMYWYPIDIFLDTDDTFALLQMNGKLFRAQLTVNDDDLQMGEPVRVRQEFIPIANDERAIVTVKRQADGRYRVTAVVATAVFMRIGAIDSRALFDSFAAHIKRTGEYPIINFHHQGGQSRLGIADYVARDENVYVVSYVLDDNEFGNAAGRTMEANPGEWGHSIEFHPTAKPDVIEIEGMKVPVYTAGINRRISILKERKAAHWFTSLKELAMEERMNKKIKDDLTELMEGDTDRADRFEAQVDDVNRTIEEEELITRTGEGDPPEQDEEEELVPAAVPGDIEEAVRQVLADVSLTPDEAFMADVINRVGEGEVFAGLRTTLQEVRTLLNQHGEALETLRRTVVALNTRVGKVEAPVADMQQRYTQNLPVQPGGLHVSVTRPSVDRASEPVDTVITSNQAVKNGLEKMKQVGLN